MLLRIVCFILFCFNDTATTEIYTYCHTLSLHDALPISWCRDAVSPALCVPFERQSCGDRTIGERREIAELDHQRVAVPTGFARGCSVEPLLRASSPRLDLDETGMFRRQDRKSTV